MTLLLERTKENRRLLMRKHLLDTQFIVCKECNKALMLSVEYDVRNKNYIENGFKQIIGYSKLLKHRFSSLYRQSEKLYNQVEMVTSNKEKENEEADFKNLNNVLKTQYFSELNLNIPGIGNKATEDDKIFFLEFIELARRNSDILRKVRDLSLCRIMDSNSPTCAMWTRKIRIISANCLVNIIKENTEKHEKQIRRYICKKINSYAKSLTSFSEDELDLITKNGEPLSDIEKTVINSFRREGIRLAKIDKTGEIEHTPDCHKVFTHQKENEGKRIEKPILN